MAIEHVKRVFATPSSVQELVDAIDCFNELKPECFFLVGVVIGFLSHQWWEVRAASAQALCAVSNHESEIVPKLQVLTYEETEDFTVRECALRALSTYPNGITDEQLLALTKSDQESMLREAAVKSLEDRKHPQAADLRTEIDREID